MSKLSFRARALDASKPMPIYLAEELPDLPDYSAINRAVPQMPSGMEKEEECEHHLQRAICTGLIIPTPEVCAVHDIEFYERCYPPDYKMPKQHIHMQPLWQEHEAPEYDIDSEDERWLKQQRHPELTELKFEQMMDKLERSSGQTVVTLNEAKLLLERHDDLVIAVYDYWLNKRLKTQHPLILSVKTESRPGQSTNNPYLAFRRRTEKMQTRKNRKNDESSYEKMLKLRRDLARALTLLELVARRERAKRDLVKLTALLAERRYVAQDFAGHLIAEIPQSRPSYTAASLAAQTARFRDVSYSAHYAPPRAPATPPEQSRQRGDMREKRPYKRRKHRHPHHAPGVAQPHRDSGVYTSSEEEGVSRAETSSPPDDGPFAFRRKAGCFYEMPTTTLFGDPVDPDNSSKDGLFEHELDNRLRFTLTTINQPYPHCIGFTRRRVARGGRIVLDRIATPLDDLWPNLPFNFTKSSRYKAERDEEVQLETEQHRNPRTLTRDYHTSGKHPWRHAFRRHLNRNPHLWTEDTKPDDPSIKPELMDIDSDKLISDISVSEDRRTSDEVKFSVDEVKCSVDEVNCSVNEVKCSVEEQKCSADEVKCNLDRVMRKRSWSGCSDSSYDSEGSLEPVEQEFEKFIEEVNKKWLHFRPKTPPPSPPLLTKPSDDELLVTMDTPLAVELRTAGDAPSTSLDTFTTSEFTLSELYGDALIKEEADNSGSSLDISGDDLLNENLGFTDAQVESILSDTIDDKKIIPDDLLDELVKDVDIKEPFLLQSQGLASGQAHSGLKSRRKERASFGSSVVSVAVRDDAPLFVDKLRVREPAPPVLRKPVKVEVKKEVKEEPKIQVTSGPATTAPAPPLSANKIVVEELNDLPQIKLEPPPQPQPKKQARPSKEDTVEEIQLSHGVQLKTVQTKHSPLKKHIITSATHRRAGEAVTLVATSQDSPRPQIVTVAVSDSLRVRLQNHLLSSQAASGAVVGLVQNGPFAHNVIAQSQPLTQTVNAQRDQGTVNASGAGTSSPRRVTAPVVHLAPAALHQKQIQLQHAQQPVVVAQSHIHHIQPNKLKVLHAHPLTQTQRTQLLAQSRAAGITQLPTVVSLATLGEAKATPTQLQLKATPGSVAQFFEIKGGQLGKGPHLVNVVRQPQPGKTTVARLDLNDAKKRQVVATFDGAQLKGNIATTTRPHRVSVSLDGRQIVRAALPPVRAPVRHQIQLKNRTLQVAAPQMRSVSEASTSITIAAPTKTASIPSSVVANLLQKNVQIPKPGQKIAISSAAGQQLAANVQAIAFTTAQLKARQARLIAPSHSQPRPQPHSEMVETPSTPRPVASTSSADPEAVADSGDVTNGAVRRRPTDALMEVT